MGGGDDVGGVVGTLDLEHGLDAGLADVEVDAFADVLDLDQVGAGVGEQVEQPGEAPGRSLIRANTISRRPAVVS